MLKGLMASRGRNIIRPLLLIAVLLSIFLLFYVWRLGSLTEGLGVAEYNSVQNSQTLNQIISQGINTPYYLTQHGLLKLPLDTVWSARLASVFFGALILSALWFFLRSWFGNASAILAWGVFVTMPWVVLTVRSAGPDVMWLWPIVIICFANWLMRAQKRQTFLWLGLCLSIAIGLYTPGLLLVVAAGTIAYWQNLKEIKLRLGNLTLITGFVLAAFTLIPLIMAVLSEPGRLRELALVPGDWQPIIETLKSIIWSFLALFWHTRSAVDIIIDQLAIINILQIALLVFGVYALVSRLKKTTYLAIGLLIFAAIAAGINSNLHLISLGMTAVALFIAAGLRFLYIEWRRVFPLNPFAKFLAYSLIIIVVGTNALYGFRYSLSAWPQTEATKSSYVLK